MNEESRSCPRRHTATRDRYPLLRCCCSVAFLVAAVLWTPPTFGDSIRLSDCQWVLHPTELDWRFDSVNLTLNGQTYSTGTIRVELDPSYSLTDNSVVLDFRDGSVTEQLHVLIGCDLLTTLGQPKQKMFLVETGGPGTFTYTDVEITEDWTEVKATISQSLSGLGVFESGQLFSGWTYENCLPTPSELWSDWRLIKNQPERMRQYIELTDNPLGPIPDEAKLNPPPPSTGGIQLSPQPGGRVTLFDPSAVPLPSAAWAGLGLFGLIGLWKFHAYRTRAA